jgi:AhpD family alkylhydroperoxidase
MKLAYPSTRPIRDAEICRRAGHDTRLDSGNSLILSVDKTGARIMSKDLFPQTTPQLAALRKLLAPDIHDSFTKFSEQVFAAGALSVKTKQLIAVAAAHVTQCPYCIRGHTKAARRHGASAHEIMEAIWVAAEMRAGAAYAHSALALDEIEGNASTAGDASGM